MKDPGSGHESTLRDAVTPQQQCHIGLTKGYQSTHHTVISSHSHVVRRSTRHRLTHHRRVFFTVNSSHGQVVTQSTRHKRALYKVMGMGPKFSGHADINDHYQRAKFACLRPLREIAGGLMFLWLLLPQNSLVKFFNLFYILLTTIRPTNGEKYRKITDSIFEKTSLENCKISNFAHSLAERF